MKKHFRLFSIFLVIILSFSFLSVNSFAAEDENLISPDLRTWFLGSNLDDSYTDPDHFIYNAELNTSRIRVRFPTHDELGYMGFSLLYELPEVQVGQNYQYQFTIPSSDVVNQISPHITDIIPSSFGEGVTMVFGVGYLDSDNFLNFYDDYSFSISYSDFPGVIGQTFKQSFRLDNIKGTPVLALMLSSVGSSESIVFLQNVSLTKVESESEKKLDGILGWLQELWNSITGGFDRIQTKIGEVTLDISGEITSSWQNISDKLGSVQDGLSDSLSSVRASLWDRIGDVITGLTGELRMLGDKIINYLLFFDDEVPDNPFEGVDSPLDDVQGYFDNLIDYLSNIGDDIETVIDSITGPVTLLDHFTKRFEWLFGIVTFTLMLIVVSRFIGL